MVSGEDPGELIQTLKENGTTARRSEYLPEEFLVVESGLQGWLKSGVLSQGRIQVQDEAAGLVVALLDPHEGESVLDCCAAPGGKTLFAAARMRGKGKLVATDASASRLSALAVTAANQGLGDFVTCIPGDARQLCRNMSAEGELFDKVLLDAPCSGTGVLAKRADLRWRRRPKDLSTLHSLQNGLLEAAAEAVKPGGLLVYSTCSIEVDENDQIIEEFLQRHTEYSFERAPRELCGIPDSCFSGDGALRMLPHKHGTDGAYAVRLRKKTEGMA